MANPAWIPEVFNNVIQGASSAVLPDLLTGNQIAWGYNLAIRGGKPRTRPIFKYLGPLPTGLVQGASFFSVQGGMGVTSIDGQLYRLRLGGAFSYQTIPQPNLNSSITKQVWMAQTVETLVIQDFQSDPLLYDGANATRSDPTNPTRPGIPRGKQMAYGNGRLWVAIDDNNLVAGDIRTNIAGSELLFTETQYLSGGGALYFSKGITALGFISVTGTSDYGALAVLGNGFVDSVRADITSRDLWSTYPGFVTTVLRQSGCAGQPSLTSVNQDLYWRDNEGGIRSIRSGLADESGAGNSPISREVSRLTDFDSTQLLGFCPSINFDNRLLMGSSPFLNDVGGISWKALISLDFAPASVMSGKMSPAYDGQWAGLNITHMFEGKIGGKLRAFAITHDVDAGNNIWEIMNQESGDIADQTYSCNGAVSSIIPSPVVAYLETPQRSFGDDKRRKRLERLDLYLQEIDGQVDIKAFWRTDNNQAWIQWDEIQICAKTTDPDGASPSDVHVWKNLLTQQRSQLKSFTIPNSIDPIERFGLQTGFSFQLRIEWTGRARIDKSILYASMMDDTPYANRNLVTDTCVDNDVTGNEIDYVIPIDAPCMQTSPIQFRVTNGDGFATLIGLPQFNYPTVDLPIKAYRNRTLTGSLSECSNESSPLFDSISTYSGSADYAVPSGSVTSNLDLALGDGVVLPQSPCSAPVVASTGHTSITPTGGPVFYAGSAVTTTTTPTSCHIAGKGTWVSGLNVTGDVYDTLGTEDTQADALLRLQASGPFSSFSTTVQTATCDASADNYPQFIAAEVQWQVSVTGLTPGGSYNAIVTLVRRIYGTAGTFSFFATQTVPGTADGSGNLLISEWVTNDPGFETKVSGDAVIEEA